jgi:hypothetical protein
MDALGLIAAIKLLVLNDDEGRRAGGPRSSIGDEVGLD